MRNKKNNEWFSWVFTKFSYFICFSFSPPFIDVIIFLFNYLFFNLSYTTIDFFCWLCSFDFHEIWFHCLFCCYSALFFPDIVTLKICSLDNMLAPCCLFFFNIICSQRFYIKMCVWLCVRTRTHHFVRFYTIAIVYATI